MSDPFDLQRFITAQEPVFLHVLEELQAGYKQTHWMWFIFPRIKGLGTSFMAQKFAISSQAEAEAYLAHPLLGPRLVQCTALVNRINGRTAEQIFGAIDTVKLRSSLTLFSQLAGAPADFAEALRNYFDGQPDPLTLERLQA